MTAPDLFGYVAPVSVDDRAEKFMPVFYAAYPLKRGKHRVVGAVRAALNRGATEDQIMEGLARYIEHKEEWRPWMHPATFLNGGHYDDDYEAEIVDFSHLDGD